MTFTPLYSVHLVNRFGGLKSALAMPNVAKVLMGPALSVIMVGYSGRRLLMEGGKMGEKYLSGLSDL